MDPVTRLRLADDFIRRFGAALRGAQLYAPSHPLVLRAFDALYESLTQLLDEQQSVAVGVIGNEVIVGDLPMPRAVAETLGEMIRRLKSLGIERIAFDRGVTQEEVQTLAVTIAHPERRPGHDAPGVEPADPLGVLNSLTHIRVGRILSEERREQSAADVATIRRLYSDATNVASSVWESAKNEGTPDPKAARALVDGLAQAVSANRTALIALTALKNYDNYTFTHMVNVSILTMSQARALGIDGSQLRELGLAALMHDIGKVRTPTEILNKPDKLDDDEFAIMRMHVVDGAEILRRTPEMPTIAPIIAFEHHLRLDGTGYPFGVRRGSLNLGTMLCSIADVYDAMRSQRAYQQAFPSERILAVMKRNDGQQFDQHLLRRFTQLLGIYPPGNLVRLDDGAIGVVVAVHAPDPFKPRVKMLRAPSGDAIDVPYEVNLWEAAAHSPGPKSVTTPLDPAEYGIDPLNHL
ncbi:MAG TPA: HD domain-containing phosphohydrolase [Vicinamibacterales bacterium]|nr:HD domain-containing phosphohydrolase [Vicinamibacterales bacterium]